MTSCGKLEWQDQGWPDTGTHPGPGEGSSSPASHCQLPAGHPTPWMLGQHRWHPQGSQENTPEPQQLCTAGLGVSPLTAAQGWGTPGCCSCHQGAVERADLPRTASFRSVEAVKAAAAAAAAFSVSRVSSLMSPLGREAEAFLSHVAVPPPHPMPCGDIASQVLRITFSHKSKESALGLGGSAPFFHVEMKNPTAGKPLSAARPALSCLPFNPSPVDLPPAQPMLESWHGEMLSAQPLAQKSLPAFGSFA